MRFTAKDSALRLADSALVRLQRVADLVRALPWPLPAQRIAKRGLTALAYKFPAIADLLDATQGKKPRPDVRTTQRNPQPRAQTAMASSDLPALLTQLQARGWVERSSAAQALAGRVEPAAQAALIAALRDRSVEVAVNAASSLGVTGSDTARDALLQIVDNAEGFYSPMTRAAAVTALGRVLPHGAHARLRLALHDPDVEVSIAAIAALIERHDPDTATQLTHILEDDHHFFLPITRLAAARGLERMRGLPAPTARGLLERESDDAVQQVLQRMAAA